MTHGSTIPTSVYSGTPLRKVTYTTTKSTNMILNLKPPYWYTTVSHTKLSKITYPSNLGPSSSGSRPTTRKVRIFHCADTYIEEYDPKLEKKQKADRAEIESKQSLALPLIIAGKSDQEVADEVGVSRQTVHNWRNKDLLFQGELEDAKESLRQAQLATISKIADKAFKTVDELLDNPDPKIRLKAALDVLKGTEWKPPK